MTFSSSTNTQQTAANTSETFKATTLSTSILHQSPFAQLDVSTRDNRVRIIEQAEAKSLELDSDVCQKARADLTNPRIRLAAEVAWLPGISPKKTASLLDTLLKRPMALRTETGIPRLAHANLIAAALDTIETGDLALDVSVFIAELAYFSDQIDPGQVAKEVNEDRVVSGFPEIKSLDQTESELIERKRYYVNAIKAALNRLSPQTLVESLTLAVNRETNNGKDYGSDLLHDLVDSYALEVQSVLDREVENANKLAQAARDTALHGESAVVQLIGRLEAVVRNWSKLAKPIQISASARGIRNNNSRNLADLIRELSLELFNKHDFLSSATQLTRLVLDVFTDLPDMFELAKEDAKALVDIEAKRMHAKKVDEELKKKISFSAEMGTFIKDKLSISSEGISWKKRHFPLELITAARWGAVKRSINGIPSGTDYTIALATRNGEMTINPTTEAIYSGFVDALWRAVGVRLLFEISDFLKSGKTVILGDMSIDDGGVVLLKHKMLGRAEPIHFDWHQVVVTTNNGAFVISAQHDAKTYGSASYINAWNTHVIEYLIREGFKKGIDKLSDLFSN